MIFYFMILGHNFVFISGISLIFLNFFLVYQNEETWPIWTKETRKKFDELSQCLVDQYSEFQLNGERVNGTLTLAENLADNGKNMESILRRIFEERVIYAFSNFSSSF